MCSRCSCHPYPTVAPPLMSFLLSPFRLNCQVAIRRGGIASAASRGAGPRGAMAWSLSVASFNIGALGAHAFAAQEEEFRGQLQRQLMALATRNK